MFLSNVIDRETWLYGLGGLGVSYLSYTPFKRLDDGYTNECRLGMRFFTWCIVKIYCYVTLCIACRILILPNDISILGIKIISWRWVIGYVTKAPEFSDNI